MSGQGYALVTLRINPRKRACVSLLSFRTRMGCCSISADKRQVCGEWKRLGGRGFQISCAFIGKHLFRQECFSSIPWPSHDPLSSGWYTDRHCLISGLSRQQPHPDNDRDSGRCTMKSLKTGKIRKGREIR